MKLDQLLDKMQREWDQRARDNARHFIADGRTNWSEEEFYRLGEQCVEQYILNDMINICQGRPPEQMKVLEIGCGAGRVTRALAGVFGQVHGVDVSGEMLRLARAACAARPNVCFYQTNGMDLRGVPELVFDFAFSMCCFHHIPSHPVIESYVGEARRLLRPGALFKFEVQGCLEMTAPADDTWLGAPFSEQQAVEMALRCGFEPRYRVGAGEERFWLWFFKG